LALLNVKNIDVYYGDYQVLHGVSFSIQAGDVFSLVGSNASGKTTLINTISGILKPKCGEIEFEGHRLDKMESHDIVEQGIVQVPEGRLLFPRMTVLENLLMGAYGKRARSKVNQSLERVYSLLPILAERKKQIAETFSGGQQQMLAIARGLMTDPKLLIFDEPSMGLSPLLVQEMFKMISDIKKEGVTILLVEQNVQQALKLADHGCVLQNGEVVMTGTGEELLNNSDLKRAYLGEL
jgi:branched-chain amino acid transport system ATP-binding protein